jgi:hypothetical protein
MATVNINTNTILRDKYKTNKRVENVLWWVEATKEVTRAMMVSEQRKKVTPDLSVRAEKAVTAFARELLGDVTLLPAAHKRVSWVSDNDSTEILEAFINAADLTVSLPVIKIKKDGCAFGCTSKPTNNPSRPY